MEALSHLDLVFCVDLTSSMQPFIRAAQQQMVAILSSLASTKAADLRVGICGYRDHSELEPTTQCYPLSSNQAATQAVLQELQAQSPADNSDAAEAVFAGLLDSLAMEWRPKSYRIIILVGDAPPHGCGATAEPWPDRWPDRDPSGLSLFQLSNRLETAGITLYSLTMSPSFIPVHDPIMRKSFEQLAKATGGTYHDACSPKGAMELFQEISSRVFGHLELDRLIYQRFFSRWAAESTSQAGIHGSHGGEYGH